MDLTYLYRRQAVSLVMAADAACGASRNAHRAFAEVYANRIAEALIAERTVHL